MALFEKILAARGLVGPEAEAFLSPDYDLSKADPYLLPDMGKAVGRLKEAHSKNERVIIYGDYDIDGLSATALLIDAFSSFGFSKVDAFIPNRFVEGYGLTLGAVDKLNDMGADLVVTVDCGSLSHEEIAYASTLGIDTIVTDHHNVSDYPPPAVAVVNPKYPGHSYPFVDLAGVGVAFKLVQAMQQEMRGLPDGHEKWLLDLVALGTVCDIVTLSGENRANVFWGLEVLKKQRRTGLKALMAVAGIDRQKLNARALGFGLGPRMNAAGRLETAQHALDMLVENQPELALERAQYLDELNLRRKSLQQAIFEEASQQAMDMIDDDVLVVSGAGWNHGVIGIVAAKLLERYKKPTYVFEEQSNGEAKGSARSFGDFSAADAIRFADEVIIKGGGHSAAAGVTLSVKQIPTFRRMVNEFYSSLSLINQRHFLLPKADVEIDNLIGVDEQLISDISKLEPFGNSNPEPILRLKNAKVTNQRRMGTDGQHVKLRVSDKSNRSIEMVAFSAPEAFFKDIGSEVSLWFSPLINDWNGRRSIEGRLLHIQDLSS
ncbi:single-stranded-DNA-specific exonuclease RecJ [Candidatus Saccharibacteria bacterium]|jgi:single-stranded-DNA-specific exonuclease|nr:single-stranded-DNA-specific exonuclease RecJ [Candidatus Saccharibacteria bacterium]